jgi:cellulose synthase/poly-beta-1,6-N-acetylglucosamine synthase-like glycosyltransferase
VLVVDNSSGDAQTERLAREAGADYVVETLPGLSRARNRGLRESRTAIVAYVDDDALPRKDWLGAILGPFADEQVAAVTGNTISSPDGEAASLGRPTRSLSSVNPLWFEIANFGGLGFGTNMALRKRFCASESLFDERLGRGALIWIAEESHAFTQLLARGLVAVHVPAAIVLHPDKPRDVEKEATASFAYWLLLFREFPEHRRDLVRFLLRRLRRKPLSWPRDPLGPGEIINSGFALKVKAAFAGFALFLKAGQSRRR